ncbi:MAG: tetratricopeptide repeat protein [Deltaproteobacteria bacterium]|nr:MAG: tetratricopeptide repeat protein [Deltaproteobacteria bacterium]TDJ05593.1 MAG: tetratricopeptide repeat protein [Deltaproteobacteria bacterium]
MIVAYINFRAGRRQQAVQRLEQVRASNSDLILARIPLAILYESEGRHEEARVLVSEILAVNPNYAANSASRLALLGSAPDEGRASLRRAGLA